jgi:hypothetical protein
MVSPRYVIISLLVTLILGVGGGLPIPWMRVLWRANWVLFMFDWVFWAIVGFAVDDLAPKFKHHEAMLGHG